MDINSISPYIRVAMHSRLKAPFKINQRIIFDYELIFIEEGKWCLTINSQTYFCNTSDVILIRPGQPHSIESCQDISVSQPHIHFDLCYDSFSKKIYVSFKDSSDFTDYEKQLIREDIFREQGYNMPFLKFNSIDHFKILFFDVIESFNSKKALYQLEYKAKMTLLLEYIFKENFPNVLHVDSKIINPINTIKEFVDNNYYNKITLKILSLQFHYSKYYIDREFKKYFGLPIITYYNDLRINAAKKLLNSGLCVSEVSNQLNFSSIYTFSRLFKIKAGVAPSLFITEINKL